MIDFVPSPHLRPASLVPREPGRAATIPRPTGTSGPTASPTARRPTTGSRCFGGIAWEWEPRRRQYYLHNFLKEQPDLNFHNPAGRRGAARAGPVLARARRRRLPARRDRVRRARPRSCATTRPGRRARGVRAPRRARPYAMQIQRYNKARPELNDLFLKPLHRAHRRLRRHGAAGRDHRRPGARADRRVHRRRRPRHGLQLRPPVLPADRPGRPRCRRGDGAAYRRRLGLLVVQQPRRRAAPSRRLERRPIRPRLRASCSPVLLGACAARSASTRARSWASSEADLRLRGPPGPVRHHLLAGRSRAATAAARRCPGTAGCRRPASRPAGPGCRSRPSHLQLAVDVRSGDAGSTLDHVRALPRSGAQAAAGADPRLDPLPRRGRAELLAFERELDGERHLLRLSTSAGASRHDRAGLPMPAWLRGWLADRAHRKGGSSTCRHAAACLRADRGGRARWPRSSSSKITKSFGPVQVIKGVDLDIHEQRVRRLRRPLGLRQVDAAAARGRARGHHLRATLHRRQGGQRPAAGRARHRDGVPVLRALPAHDRLREHGLRPEARAAPTRRRPSERVRDAARILQIDHLLDRKPRAALGRAAPAGRDRPGDRARPARVPVRRAALEPRRGAARADAHRDREAAPRAERHDDLRHARPGRGDDAGRPDRGAGRRPGDAVRLAARALPPPGQPVRRRLHRLAEDEHPAGQRAERLPAQHAGRPAGRGRGAAGAPAARRRGRDRDRGPGGDGGAAGCRVVRLPGRRPGRAAGRQGARARPG